MLSGTHASSGPPTCLGDSAREEMLDWLHGAHDQTLKDVQAGRHICHLAGKAACVGGYMASS